MSVKSASEFETPEEFGPGTVWVERVGVRQFVGRNQRGVEIPIGTEEGQINPGELLKLALIGCAGMSMDIPAQRRLGEDFAAKLWAHGTSDPEENRYLSIMEQIQFDLKGLSEKERATLSRVIEKAIDVACTIQRTVVNGAPVSHTVIDAEGKK